MLSYFKIQNFKSILDLELSLSFDEGKLPNGYNNSDTDKIVAIGNLKNKETRFVPVLSIYGANASGKTNIVKALRCFMDIMFDDIKGKYFPNKLNNKYNSTKFEIGLFEKNKLYTYVLEYNNTTIINEKLYEDNNENKIIFEIKNQNCNFKNISTKEYSEDQLEKFYNVECQENNIDVQENTEKNQIKPFLQRIGKNYQNLNDILYLIFSSISKLCPLLSNEIPLPVGIEELSNSLKIEVSEAFRIVTDLLRNLDFNIDKMELNRQEISKDDNNKSIINTFRNCYKSQKNDKYIIDNVLSYHKDINGQNIEFNFLTEESKGTRVSSGLIGVLLTVLKEGATIFVDELDCSLHPFLLIKLISLFKDKRYNKNGAQLIFTTHNTDILDDDLMRKSEIAIVNKNLKDGTTLNKLSNFEGIRNVTNFRKQYLSGMFAGIPFPYI